MPKVRLKNYDRENISVGSTVILGEKYGRQNSKSKHVFPKIH